MATCPVSEQSSETLDCPICLKEFISPRALPCFHTTCEECLATHIQEQVNGGSGLQFTCPICKATTAPTNNKLSTNLWASSFPLNTMVIHFMDLSRNPGNTDKYCEPCKAQGEETIAEVWCTDCKEQLCCSCKRSHKAMKISRHHSTVSLDEIDEGQRSGMEKTFEQDCARHTGKSVELFCMDHRELCCVVCFASRHNDCNVKDIDDVVDEQKRKLPYQNIIKDSLNKIKLEMNKAISWKRSNTDQIGQEKEMILRDVNAALDELIRKLNDHRETIRDDTERIHREQSASLRANERTMQCFMKNISNVENILTSIESKVDVRQHFIVYETMRLQIMLHYQRMKSDLADDSEVHLTLGPQAILQDLEITLNSKNSVDVTSHKVNISTDILNTIDNIMKKVNSQTKPSSRICSAQVEKRDMMSLQVTFVKAVTNVDLGKRRCFTGGAILNDGRILMADYTNRQLVELNDEYKFVKGYQLDCQPRKIAAARGDNEFYMSVDSFNIYHCTLTQVLTVVRKIRVKGGAWGVAVSDRKIISASRGTVNVMAEDGSQLKSLSANGVQCCVVVSPSGNLYFHDKDCVVCSTVDGKELFRYGHRELQGLRGICLDSDNNVYACGLFSKNLHQISADGRRSRTIVRKTHNINSPYSLMVHPRKNELIVTSWNDDTVFEVYKFG